MEQASGNSGLADFGIRSGDEVGLGHLIFP
jgi:hypothetical protein